MRPKISPAPSPPPPPAGPGEAIMGEKVWILVFFGGGGKIEEDKRQRASWLGLFACVCVCVCLLELTNDLERCWIV